MRILVAGAHGQVGRRLGRLLATRGDVVLGLVRNPAHADDLRSAGVEPVVLDMEQSGLDEVGLALDGADAVVFSAGAGPGSADDRKDSVDRAGVALLADACGLAGVDRFLLVSSAGVEQVRDGSTPAGVDPSFVTYLRAKLAAEQDLVARQLAWTVLRPGRLTDEAGTGRVQLGPHLRRADVPRDDVAAVLAALLQAPATARRVLELTGGDVPVAEAVAALR